MTEIDSFMGSMPHFWHDAVILSRVFPVRFRALIHAAHFYVFIQFVGVLPKRPPATTKKYIYFYMLQHAARVVIFYFKIV